MGIKVVGQTSDRHPPKGQPKSWITKKKETPNNKRLKGGYDPNKQSDPKQWITKKEKPKKTNWIVKKQPKTNWITKKEAKEHDTTSARKWITKKKPVRSPHGIGGKIIKKIISKVKKEPKGVDKNFLDFIKTGKYVDKDGVKVNVPKVAERLTGKPHVDHGIRKRNKDSKKVFKSAKGKAEGGRIGLSHGGSVGAAIRGRGAEIK